MLEFIEEKNGRRKVGGFNTLDASMGLLNAINRLMMSDMG